MPLFTGNSGHNNLRGTAGRDTINGLAGNDTINPGHGADVVNAGPGADVVQWAHNPATRNVIDIYNGGYVSESYDPDPYFARSGGDRLVLVQETAVTGFRVNFSSTEDGHALDMFGNHLNFNQFERLVTGSGNDTIDGSRATIEPERGTPGTIHHVPVHGIDVTAGAGNDHIIGSRANDNIDGGSGNDTIFAGGGWDFIQSSTGDDLIYGEGGNDNIRWGQGNPAERIGNDTIYGGEADEQGGDLLNIWVKDWAGLGVKVDFHSSESGSAITNIGGGTSTLRFYQFENFFTHEGRDTVSAANATLVHGNTGVRFNTRWGDDLLTGSRGNDTLEGGDGADTIDGLAGDDFISMVQDFSLPIGTAVPPDAQRDTLVMRDGGGFDTIRAFQVGDVRNSSGQVIRAGDVLDLRLLHDLQGNMVDVNDVRVTETNGMAVLTFPGGEGIMLEGVRAASLTRARLLQMGFNAPSGQRIAAADLPIEDSDKTAKHDHGKDCDTTKAPCFCAGTLIDTPNGAVAVEALKVGDLVLTRDNGPRPVRWAGRRVLTQSELRLAPNLRPILIRAGALGRAIPDRDLMVSPQHRVLVRSVIAQRMFGAAEVLVAARQLLALDGIEQLDVAQVDYVHILFDDHEVVTSNGALTESLYTGSEALKALGQAAVDEIFAIFPELRDRPAMAARPLIPGARARQLAERHLRNAKPLVSA